MEISPGNIGSGPASGDSFLETIALPVKSSFWAERSWQELGTSSSCSSPPPPSKASAPGGTHPQRNATCSLWPHSRATEGIRAVI